MILPERPLCIAPGIGASLAVADRASSIAAIILPTEAMPRSGPGRLHAALCRRLAAAGIPALRFDAPSIDAESVVHHGMRRDHQPDRGAILAMDALEDAIGIDRHLLIGTGAGAYAAYRAAVNDRRVAGIALINPHDFVGDPAWTDMVLVQRYMRRSSRSLWSWIGLMNGRADYGRILSTLTGRMMSWVTGRDVVAKARARTIAVRMMALIEGGCQVMCLVTDRHSSLDHTLALFGTFSHRGFQSRTIRGADHLMRAPQQRDEAIERLLAWAVGCSADPHQADDAMAASACDPGSDELAGNRRA
jgi:hypothetical protein